LSDEIKQAEGLSAFQTIVAFFYIDLVLCDLKNLDSTPCCSPGASAIATTAVSLKAHANEKFKVIQNPGFLPDHPKIESLVDCAMPDIPSKFQKDPSITF